MSLARWIVPGLLAGAAVGVAAGRARRFDLRGRVVVITGGSRGLGVVLARRFTAAGARVALLARDERALVRAAADVRSCGGEAYPVVCDVRVEEQCQAAVARVVARWGRLDVLVNNAGVMQFGPLEHATVEDVHDALHTHILGPLHMTRAALPFLRSPTLRASGGSRIVNVASIGGLAAAPHMLAYCASKFGLVGLSDGLRVELRRHGVLVTTVCPGLMRTGSPPNARFKGQHRREFSWFLLGSSLPGLSVSAERAAEQIVRACVRGAPRLVIGAPAKTLALADRLAPGLVGQAMSLFARLLPGPDPSASTRSWSGRESRSSFPPAWATRLSDEASVRNLELSAVASGYAP